MRLAALTGIAVILMLATVRPAVASPTVAVLYFDHDGTSQELAFLRKGLAQMLVADLVSVPGITVVERARLEEVLAELELQRSARIDRRSAVRVGKLLGARYLVMGGYFAFRDELQVTVKIVDVETGAVVAGLRDRRKSDAFWELQQHLAAELGRVLGETVARPPAAQAPARAPRAATRRSPDQRAAPASKPAASAVTPAARAVTPAASAQRGSRTLRAAAAARYGRALDAMDRGDLGAARADLEAVLREAPDFEMASVDLASLAR